MAISVIPKTYTGADFVARKHIQSDIEANIPVAGMVAGDLFVATDTQIIWAYDGSDWVDCKPFKGGDNLYSITGNTLYADDGEEDTDSTSYVKLKEFTISGIDERFVDVTIRISFNAKNGGNPGNTKVLHNAVLVNERAHPSSSYTEYTDDVPDCNDGDTISLWAKCDSAVWPIYVKFFRILGNAMVLDETATPGFTAEVTA